MTAQKKARSGRPKSAFVDVFQRMLKNKGATIGLIIFLLIVLASIFAPLLTPYSPTQMDMMNIHKGPSAKHWFGTDIMGRDIFTRILYGGRYSLMLGIAATLVGSAVGIIIGCIAGYFGGVTETVLMRFMDVWSSIPGQMMAIIISAVLGGSFVNTVFALSIGRVPGSARMIRGQILAERKKEYIEAAKALNISNGSIMFRHILPNVISPMIVSMTMSIGGTITVAAGLSYIGLGVQPPTAEWGALLSDARSYISSYPYMMIFPGLAIMLTVLAINMMGDGLRDALDPKMRA